MTLRYNKIFKNKSLLCLVLSLVELACRPHKVWVIVHFLCVSGLYWQNQKASEDLKEWDVKCKRRGEVVVVVLGGAQKVTVGQTDAFDKSWSIGWVSLIPAASICLRPLVSVKTPPHPPLRSDHTPSLFLISLHHPAPTQSPHKGSELRHYFSRFFSLKDKETCSVFARSTVFPIHFILSFSAWVKTKSQHHAGSSHTCSSFHRNFTGLAAETSGQ